MRPGLDVSQDGLHGFRDSAFVDAQYLAEKGFYSVLMTEYATLTNGKQSIDLQFKKSDRLVKCLAVVDPQPDDLDRLRKAAAFASIVITLSDASTLGTYVPTLEKLFTQDVRLLVLLPTHTVAEHEAAVGIVRQSLRGQIFPPFTPVGKDEALSIHQQQMEAVVKFMERAKR